MIVDWFIKLLTIFIAVALGIIIHYKIAFKYWKKKNIAQIQQPKIPFGDLPNVLPLKIYIGSHFKNMYDEAKSRGYKIIGYFICSTAKCLPIDPEYIRNILQRDFNYFTERGFFYNEKDDPLSANLFAIGGDKWQKLRSKLSPAYTSGKIKTMFDGLLRCSYQMKDSLEKISASTQTVNMKDISECFTINVIGSCAFGVECNCFQSPESEFRKQGKKIFFIDFLQLFKVIVAFSYPTLGRWLGIRLFDKDTTEFFTNVVKHSLKYRRENHFVRKDFLQLLLDLRDDNVEEHLDYSGFSIEELTAQVFIFFAAGFETTSITLAFCIYELASNEDIQNKAREEIHQVLKEHQGKITYESVMDMKFINQIVKGVSGVWPKVVFHMNCVGGREMYLFRFNRQELEVVRQFVCRWQQMSSDKKRIGAGKKIFFLKLPRILKTIFAFSYPTLGRWFGVRFFDKPPTEFFVNMIRDLLEYREANNFVRKDFLQLLLDLRNDLQSKIREEIDGVVNKHQGKITYDAIMDMKYMNQVVEETLRKYPPVSFITRVAVQDYQIPGTDTIIEKGTEAVIPILGLHHDPEYYPEPDKFDPERFSDQNKQQRRPFTYMPFGEGPRICIGLRFGLMQVKVGLAVLLKHYKFSLNSKTKVPLEMIPSSFTLTPKNGIFVDVERVI